jgi:GNAT superfamily N-acetyltransferase
MNLRYCENKEVTASDIMSVFESVGWNKSTENIIAAFQNSWYILAYDEDRLVGFARAISDCYYYTGIYDVVVRPEYQRKGIARTMVQRLLDKFKGTYFFLTYTEGNRELYAKCGFTDNKEAMWIPKG